MTMTTNGDTSLEARLALFLGMLSGENWTRASVQPLIGNFAVRGEFVLKRKGVAGVGTEYRLTSAGARWLAEYELSAVR